MSKTFNLLYNIFSLDYVKIPLLIILAAAVLILMIASLVSENLALAGYIKKKYIKKGKNKYELTEDEKSMIIREGEHIFVVPVLPKESIVKIDKSKVKEMKDAKPDYVASEEEKAMAESSVIVSDNTKGNKKNRPVLKLDPEYLRQVEERQRRELGIITRSDIENEQENLEFNPIIGANGETEEHLSGEFGGAVKFGELSKKAQESYISLSYDKKEEENYFVESVSEEPTQEETDNSLDTRPKDWELNENAKIDILEELKRRAQLRKEEEEQENTEFEPSVYNPDMDEAEVLDAKKPETITPQIDEEKEAVAEKEWFETEQPTNSTAMEADAVQAAENTETAEDNLIIEESEQANDNPTSKADEPTIDETEEADTKAVNELSGFSEEDSQGVGYDIDSLNLDASQVKINSVLNGAVDPAIEEQVIKKFITRPPRKGVFDNSVIFGRYQIYENGGIYEYKLYTKDAEEVYGHGGFNSIAITVSHINSFKKSLAQGEADIIEEDDGARFVLKRGKAIFKGYKTESREEAEANLKKVYSCGQTDIIRMK